MAPRPPAPGDVEATSEAAPAGPLRRVVLACSYDGAGFHGFASQRRVRTVQGTLEAALRRRLGVPVTSRCAGRTDAGVHALAQVVHADLPEATLLAIAPGGAPRTELPELSRALSKLVGPEINVWRAFVAPEGFDARHSAVARRYRYVIETDGRADPLYRAASWRVPEPLDLNAMRLACDPLFGEHDFCAFCRQPSGKERGPLRRRIFEARWERRGSLLCFEIEANAFCQQMVRALVGMLVAVGRGRHRPSEMMERLREPDRSGLPTPAPAAGLTLVAVRYPSELGGTFSKTEGLAPEAPTASARGRIARGAKIP